jgi:hypothetical protein
MKEDDPGRANETQSGKIKDQPPNTINNLSCDMAREDGHLSPSELRREEDSLAMRDSGRIDADYYPTGPILTDYRKSCVLARKCRLANIVPPQIADALARRARPA